MYNSAWRTWNVGRVMDMMTRETSEEQEKPTSLYTEECDGRLLAGC